MSYKFTHINLIAKDWKSLSKFYQDVFGCIPVLPERRYSGKLLEKGTAIPNSELNGIHLKLPGFEDNGPTLEIYSYNQFEKKLFSSANRLGYGHIAFVVDDVEEARENILKSGGKSIGEIVTLQLSNCAKVKWCYVTDIEDNIIELQKWFE